MSHGDPAAAAAARAVPARLDARGRRRAGRHHVDRVPADRGARHRGRHARWSSPWAGASGSPRPGAGWPSTRSRSSPRSTPPASTSTRPPSRPAPCARGLRHRDPPLAAARRRPSSRRRIPRCSSRSPSTSRSRRSGCSRRDAVDLALIYDYTPAPAPFDRTVEATPLWSVEWGLGVPAGKPVAERERRCGRRRLPRPRLDRELAQHRRRGRRAASLASMAGFAPRIVHRADSLDLLEDLIVAGLGVGLLPLDGRSRPACGCCPWSTPTSVSARTPSPGPVGWPGLRSPSSLIFSQGGCGPECGISGRGRIGRPAAPHEH